MSAIGIVGWGAISALGEGDRAFAIPKRGERATTCVRRDDALASAGLLRPFCARAPIATSKDRATELFERALDACARDLDTSLPGWRGRRVGLAIGTSSGGMSVFEGVPDGDRVPLAGTYIGPALAAKRPCAFSPFSLVLGACASSTLALGLARQWLLEDACDVALAGGFDALGVFVPSGFEVLRATSAVPGPRPFRKGRDGLALGEGAAVIALARTDDARAWIEGFGASCDATHLTAPDRTGGGLARAMRQAMHEAGIARADLVSAHGTATPFNDEAEAKAIAGVAPAVHAFKGTIGHTLGAAGALETLAAVLAMTSSELPASYGEGELEDGVRVLDATEPGELARVVKLASAFGGANAAIVVTKTPSANERELRAAYVSRAVHVREVADPATLAARTGYSEDRIARADDLVRLTLAAVAALEERVGDLEGAGIVAGHGFATLETNVAYRSKMRKAGPAHAEPRRFPFTTPNAGAGEAAIAFGLTGPAFAVGGGPHGGIEALAVAASLVRGRVADRIVVVAADEARDAARLAAPGTESGAVALLVSASPLEARIEDASVRLEAEPMPESAFAKMAMHAHRALLPLTGRQSPERIEAPLPWGGFANARFFWL